MMIDAQFEIDKGLKKSVENKQESQNKYLLSDIVIEGIEPTEEYKALMKKEKRGEITTEEIAEITRCPYVVKE